jgi:hypothetical protein
MFDVRARSVSAPLFASACPGCVSERGLWLLTGTRLCSFVRCVLSSTIVQQSTWLKSSKQWDVDCSTFRPHACTSACRTSAQSPDMSTEATASCAVARRSRAVPGQSHGQELNTLSAHRHAIAHSSSSLVGRLIAAAAEAPTETAALRLCEQHPCLTTSHNQECCHSRAHMRWHVLYTPRTSNDVSRLAAGADRQVVT